MTAFWTFWFVNLFYLGSAFALLAASAWISVSQQIPNFGAAMGLMVALPLLLIHGLRRFSLGMYVSVWGVVASAILFLVGGIAIGDLAFLLPSTAGLAYCMIAFGLFWALVKLDPRNRTG